MNISDTTEVVTKGQCHFNVIQRRLRNSNVPEVQIRQAAYLCGKCTQLLPVSANVYRNVPCNPSIMLALCRDVLCISTRLGPEFYVLDAHYEFDECYTLAEDIHIPCTKEGSKGLVGLQDRARSVIRLCHLNTKGRKRACSREKVRLAAFARPRGLKSSFNFAVLLSR